jgi:hypothetical protein
MPQRNLPTQRSSDLKNASHVGSAIQRGDQIIPNRSSKMPLSGAYTQESIMDAFAELHAERMYLLNCLQHENRNAADILRKTLALEEVLLSTPASVGRRDAKRKLGWLKCRIKETHHHERAILRRLGQLSFEIQARDVWMQVKAERHREFHYSEPPQGQPYMQRSSARDKFQPVGWSTSYGNSTWEDVGKRGKCLWPPCTPHGIIGLPTDNHGELDSVVTANLGLPTKITGYEPSQTILTIPRSSSMNSVDLSTMGKDSSFLSVPRAKRHSL